MAGREPAPEELAAADVVAGALGGRWESRDGEDGPQGMHDFDVILPDGRCIALEVTSAIDGAVVALSDSFRTRGATTALGRSRPRTIGS